MTEPTQTIGVTPPSTEAPGTDSQTEPTGEVNDTGQQNTPESISYDDWLDRLEKDESLKTEHTTRTQEREKELGKETYRKFQSNIQPAIDRWSQNSQASREGITRMTQQIEKAVKNGTLDADEVTDIFQSNKPVMDAINGGQWWEGTYYILGQLGTAVDDTALAQEFLGRIYQGAQSGRLDPQLLPDLLDRITDNVVKSKLKEAEDKGYQKGIKEGQKVSKEENRAENRAGNKGPDLKDKAPPPASKVYSMTELSKMTREQVMSIPKEDRDAAMVASRK